MVRIGWTCSEFGLLAYLTTCPEYEYGTFIPSGTLDNLKVVKLWKRVWFYLIFGPILVWFRSEFWDVETDLTIWSTDEAFANNYPTFTYFCYLLYQLLLWVIYKKENSVTRCQHCSHLGQVEPCNTHFHLSWDFYFSSVTLCLSTFDTMESAEVGHESGLPLKNRN